MCRAEYRAGATRRIIRCLITVGTAFVCLGVSEVHAAFGRYLPLSFSGGVTYTYGYVTAAGNESETTTLTGSLNASGYIWQPWFATTSAALTLGVSSTDTSSSSSDSSVSSGTLSINVFPRSRFPFSMTYSVTDSRAESFSDLTQVSGDVQSRISRLSLRQAYRARSGSLTNLWYYASRSESGVVAESESYGATYQVRWVPHSLSISASSATSSNSETSVKPLTQVVSLNHSYLPGGDLGVTNLLTYVDTDSGDDSTSVVSQLSSSFYWRPEHRAVNISGGVRLSDSETDVLGTVSRKKSFDTNIGVGYRLTRRLHLGASASLGTADSGTTQTLTTTQSVQANYFSEQHRIGGFFYNWQMGGNAGNTTTRTDTAGVTTNSDAQSYGLGAGHSASTNWNVGRNVSMSLNLSQSLSGSKSSELDEISKLLNHGLGLTWNRRGQVGTTYVNFRATDTRSFGNQESVYQQAGVNMSQDVKINRFSGLAVNASYQASQGETESANGETIDTGQRSVNGSMYYHHDRPFGVYNLTFTSQLTGNKEIASETPSTTMDWDNRFQYQLGLLSTSLSLRIIETAGGALTKSMYFQATRSF